MAPEKLIQNQILTWLRFKGFLAWHIPNHGLFSRRTGRYNIVDHWHVPGIPDLEVVIPGGLTVRIEVKSKSGRLSEHQQAMIQRLSTMGHPCLVARSLSDVEKYFKEGGFVNE